MASSVGPAAHIDCHANGGGMARRIFDMNAHNGIFSAHPLGPKANGIDSILQKLFHISRSLIFIVGTNGTHQRLLGQQSRCLHRGGHAHTYEKRRTGIQAISCHHIHNKFCHTFVTGPRHQHHGLSRKGAAAACHIGVNLTFITVRHNIPEYGGSSLSHVFSCVILVKSFHTIVPERCLKSCTDHSLFQKKS